MKQAEFDGERGVHYDMAHTRFPEARSMDISAMHLLLNPQEGESILGFGEGNGYFCRAIAQAVGTQGYYLVTDPSADQLANLEKRVNLPQIETRIIEAEKLRVPEEFFDKVWSFGAFHHVQNQRKAMGRIYRALRPGGKLVLCDVFQGSDLAKHSDSQVARYCVTGHEVKFLSDEFAKTLCYLSGFEEEKVEIKDLPQKWIFDTEIDIGEFIHDLHALTRLPGSREERISKTLEGCREILGIEYANGKYELNWPMKAIIAIK